MISLVIPGKPPAKNDKHKVFVRTGQKGGKSIGRMKSEAYVAFLERALEAWLATRQERIESGLWMARIRAYWGSQRHLDHDVGLGDVDAPIECVLDALQVVGAIDNDARVVALIATKHYDKERPRVEVELRPWEVEE